MGIRNKVYGLLEKYWNRRYRQTLQKRRREVGFSEVYAFSEGPAFSAKEAVAAELSARLSDTGFSLFFTGEGRLHRDTLEQVGSFFLQNEKVQILYGDGIENNEACAKSAWSPDSWLTQNTMGQAVFVRKTDKGQPPVCAFPDENKLREKLMERIRETDAYEKNQTAVSYVPQIWYRLDREETTEILPLKNPVQPLSRNSLSVIIPSKDHPELLQQCLESLLQTDFTKKLEILIVDNGSSAENQKRIAALTDALTARELPVTFRYLYEEMPFNFSRMCNRGAAQAEGDILLFLNDDIECRDRTFLDAVFTQASMPYSGAVGCKLYYPNSRKVQHLGIQNLPGGPVHKFQFQEETEPFLHGRQNVLAVTGACLAVRKEIFEEAGGFPECLSVAYNDVALCMQICKMGWQNAVLTEHALYHHESASRGNDISREKLQRLKAEREELYTLFPEYRGYDPFYSRFGSIELGDPFPGNRFFKVEQVRQKSSIRVCGQAPAETAEKPEISWDAEKKEGCIIVPFRNNALYRHFLFLQPAEGGRIYRIRLDKQYSAEGAFWKQEQPNCALSGFDLKDFSQRLPQGNYRMGFLSQSRIGLRKLFTWTEYRLEVK